MLIKVERSSVRFYSNFKSVATKSDGMTNFILCERKVTNVHSTYSTNCEAASEFKNYWRSNVNLLWSKFKHLLQLRPFSPRFQNLATEFKITHNYHDLHRQKKQQKIRILFFYKNEGRDLLARTVVSNLNANVRITPHSCPRIFHAAPLKKTPVICLFSFEILVLHPQLLLCILSTITIIHTF